MAKITSYADFISRLDGKEKVYLLLYKSGSEKSDCALKNIQAGSETVKDISVFYADVTDVRDIHTRYNITTVPVLMEFRRGELINVIKGCNDTIQYKAMFEDKVLRVFQGNEEKKTFSITVYSTPSCSWCNALKNYLKQHNVKYTDIDLSRDQRAADLLVKRSGQMGVPQTDINGEIIVGFDKNRINVLLGIKD